MLIEAFNDSFVKAAAGDESAGQQAYRVLTAPGRMAGRALGARGGADAAAAQAYRSLTAPGRYVGEKGLGHVLTAPGRVAGGAVARAQGKHRPELSGGWGEFVPRFKQQGRVDVAEKLRRLYADKSQSAGRMGITKLEQKYKERSQAAIQGVKGAYKPNPYGFQLRDQ